MQLQIEEVSRKLRSGDLGIPANIEERYAALCAVSARKEVLHTLFELTLAGHAFLF